MFIALESRRAVATVSCSAVTPWANVPLVLLRDVVVVVGCKPYLIVDRVRRHSTLVYFRTHAYVRIQVHSVLQRRFSYDTRVRAFSRPD